MSVLSQSFGILLLTLAFCGISCRHTEDPVSTHTQALPWAGFGKPGPGKIAVEIAGDVKHPGHYYLNEGANLDNVYWSFGGWFLQDGGLWTPHQVKLERQVDGRETSATYHIKKMKPEERAAVVLKDGDRLYYPRVLLDAPRVVEP